MPPRPRPARPFTQRLRRSSAAILRRLDALDPSTAGDPRTSGRQHVVLVTFRHGGRRVATPVWAASDGELFYVRTRRDSGKMKRLRGNNFVLLAPCTARGRPVRAPVGARVRLLPPHEAPAAERLLREHCGPLRAAVTTWQTLRAHPHCWLAIALD